MNTLVLRGSRTLIFLLVFWILGAAFSAGEPEKNGRLVVIVTLGDVANTAARNVTIQVHGYVPKYPADRSIILKPSRDGQYEASLEPGLYDVLVSEVTSMPRCKRVEIGAVEAKYWTLKLEIDEEHLEKSKNSLLHIPG